LPSISRFSASAGAIAFARGGAPGAGGSAAMAALLLQGMSAATAPVLRKSRRETRASCCASPHTSHIRIPPGHGVYTVARLRGGEVTWKDGLDAASLARRWH